MTAPALAGGFAAPATDAAFAFRAIMDAMARPGRLHRVTGARGPAPLSPAAAVVLLTLCDTQTPVHLAPGHDTAEIRTWLAFHCAAPICDAGKAQFAIGFWPDLCPLDRFATGTPDYPDRSATLIVDMPALTNSGATLRGPGIRETARLSLPERAAFQTNARAFPLGLDFIFTAQDTVAALPRSTEVS